jgi:hypothetical protein
MDKLGMMIRITNLRTVWPQEANDFTKWLNPFVCMNVYVLKIKETKN